MFKLFNLIFLFFLFIVIHKSYSQDQDMEQIKNTFYQYINTIEKDDYKASLNYINTDIFNYVSKEKFLKSLHEINNNEKLEFKLSDSKIQHIEPLTKIENQYYTILSYSSTVSLKFNSINSARTKEDELNFIKRSFEKKKLKSDISFDKASDSYQFMENLRVCVNSNDNRKSWKFLVIDTSKKDFLTKILPQEIINKF